MGRCGALAAAGISRSPIRRRRDGAIDERRPIPRIRVAGPLARSWRSFVAGARPIVFAGAALVFASAAACGCPFGDARNRIGAVNPLEGQEQKKAHERLIASFRKGHGGNHPSRGMIMLPRVSRLQTPCRRVPTDFFWRAVVLGIETFGKMKAATAISRCCDGRLRKPSWIGSVGTTRALPHASPMTRRSLAGVPLSPGLGLHHARRFRPRPRTSLPAPPEACIPPLSFASLAQGVSQEVLISP
jgi:hypothetical protein